jgi:osmotically-inducible protein OsmY
VPVLFVNDDEIAERVEAALFSELRVDDAELRGRALRALSSNAAVPRIVDSGVVTLTGIADSHIQREQAAVTVSTQLGVDDVDNRILVRASSA